MMLAGAQVIYLEAYPLPAYSMYGAVPLREIKSKLLALKRAGKLDRVKMMLADQLHVRRHRLRRQRVMEECLAIKPDLVFLWDEAWFAFARFHPVYRNRTAMTAARNAAGQAVRRELQASVRGDAGGRCEAPADRRRAAEPPADAGSGQGQGAGLRHPVDPQDADVAAAGLDDPRLRPGLRRRRSPSRSTRPTWPTRRRRRTTRSWRRSTSGRRQVALEGVELVQRQIENAMQLRDAIDNHPLLSRYMALPAHVGPDPRRVPPVAHRPAAAVRAAQHDGRVGHRRVRARPVAHHAVDRRAPASTATPSSANS